MTPAETPSEPAAMMNTTVSGSVVIMAKVRLAEAPANDWEVVVRSRCIGCLLRSPAVMMAGEEIPWSVLAAAQRAELGSAGRRVLALLEVPVPGAERLGERKGR